MTNGLLVAAHYDDPVIWAGGFVRRTRSTGWDWTVLATCVEERSRRAYFEAWCRSLGARSVGLRFVDHPDGGPFSRNDRAALREAILAVVQRESFDRILTHSLDPEGEYGPHPNHTEAAQAVASLVEEGILRPDRVARFAYRRIYGAGGVPSVAAIDASGYLPLTYDELRWKADWCARAQAVELRDRTLDGRTWLERLAWPCPDPEAFAGEGLGSYLASADAKSPERGETAGRGA